MYRAVDPELPSPQSDIALGRQGGSLRFGYTSARHTSRGYLASSGRVRRDFMYTFYGRTQASPVRWTSRIGISLPGPLPVDIARKAPVEDRYRSQHGSGTAPHTWSQTLNRY